MLRVRFFSKIFGVLQSSSTGEENEFRFLMQPSNIYSLFPVFIFAFLWGGEVFSIGIDVVNLFSDVLQCAKKPKILTCLYLGLVLIFLLRLVFGVLGCFWKINLCSFRQLKKAQNTGTVNFLYFSKDHLSTHIHILDDPYAKQRITHCRGICFH